MLVYCTYYIALCWQYPWDIYVESWKPVLKLKSSYVLIDAFYLESIALWVNSYAKLFDACLESTIHEKFLLIWFSCLFIIYLLATIDHCLGSLHSWLVLYIIIWSRLCGSMSPQKLFCFYRFTYSRTSRTKLGDAWYVSNVSIISDVPCWYYANCYMFSIHFIAFLCIFWD